MSTADRTINVDSDQLELIALAVDALAAAAGDRAASDRMGDFYETMARERSEHEIVAKCRRVSDIILAALDRDA
jgi:hypothetical protein